MRLLRSMGTAGLPLLLAGCICQNDVVEETRSPDGQHRVVTFMRNCGATSGFNTQVSLLGRAPLFGGGNVLVIDSNHGAAPEGRGGGPEVRLRWSSPDTLRIGYDARARVFKAVRERRGVTILYEPWNTLPAQPGAERDVRPGT